jgi:L-fucose mutarotase/ribose pyranase (RbsD/FucU family)
MPGNALAPTAQRGWEQRLADQLPLMGHRNWIVIVDSAYPLQTSRGVEMIETGVDQLTVIREVLNAIRDSKHVRPVVYTDAELAYVPESKAPGVDDYRAQLKELLAESPAHSLLHVELIDRLNETGKSFQVLVLKTNMTIPYASVFVHLDCKYWSADAEANLRVRMNAG